MIAASTTAGVLGRENVFRASSWCGPRGISDDRSSKSGSIDGNSYKKIIGNPQAETQKNGFPFLFGNDFGSASVLSFRTALYTPLGAPLLFFTLF
jgi:hypothetical protein